MANRNAQAMNEALLSKPDFTGQAMDRFAFQLWQQLCRKAGTEYTFNICINSMIRI